jgi:DNA segregation ATPase FtsK/SpoIIIE, S-DNA-T family
MTRSFLKGGAEVLVTAPRTSPLRELEGKPGVRAVLTDEDLMESELTEHLGGDGPVVLVMDDAELHKDFMAGDYMRSFIRAAGERTGVVIAGNSADVCGGFMGWQIDIKKNRSGVLLSPQDLGDGDLLGVRLPRSVVGGQVQPGRALMHLGDGELVSLQVPLMTAAEV